MKRDRHVRREIKMKRERDRHGKREKDEKKEKETNANLQLFFSDVMFFFFLKKITKSCKFFP